MASELNPHPSPYTRFIFDDHNTCQEIKQQYSPAITEMSNHEALNPIHPSVLPHLDPVFIDLYNTNVANTPNKPIDLNVLRSKYSVLYSYGTGPAPEPARIYDSQVPGHNGDPIPVRVYEPATAGPWPVHLDFHGGGMTTHPPFNKKRQSS